MPLVLRVDVDKPYGHHTFPRKVISKIREDYWFPAINSIGYLSHLVTFLEFCNNTSVPGHFYHRLCTVPNEKVKELLKRGNHHFGWHAENTKSKITFKKELDMFISETSGLTTRSFTKHGSGQIKIGKHHYPPYEPLKYHEWSVEFNIPYYFGNGIAKAASAFKVKKFYPEMFWMEHDYRDPQLNTIEQVIEISRNHTVPVLIHPSNYITDNKVRLDFEKLVTIAKREEISWKVL